ncbi:hypothetical protein [Halorussus halobius]|uniref:hypothetical protein n=1 Tax=Halorussus halobius TaxID=1710537 RepID=UPI00143CE688|nr:hypothetical protein [Halorussus halobius]
MMNPSIGVGDSDSLQLDYLPFEVGSGRGAVEDRKRSIWRWQLFLVLLQLL